MNVFVLKRSEYREEARVIGVFMSAEGAFAAAKSDWSSGPAEVRFVRDVNCGGWYTPDLGEVQYDVNEYEVQP